MTRARIRLRNFLLGIALALPVILLADLAVARTPKINVAVGQSITQETEAPIKTVSIADSKVADVVVAGPREILINGKRAGFTTLVVWDQNNNSTIYRVVVRGAFSDQQIELRVQVAEINRRRLLELGTDFLFTDTNGPRDLTGGSYGGETAIPSIPLQIFGNGFASGTSLALGYASGGHEITAMIHALQEKGILRLLAEPTLVASSGNEASFLSGGELPIPVAQGGTASGAFTIEWKEYGVRVNFLPTIVDSGVISLKVAPEVSALDFSAGTSVGGISIPALTVRRAETTVELEDGQVLVIGGLIREDETNVVRKIPVLGHIPLIGVFFTNVKKVKTNQELILVISPHIIRALPRGTKVVLPGVNGAEG